MKVRVTATIEFEADVRDNRELDSVLEELQDDCVGRHMKGGFTVVLVR